MGETRQTNWLLAGLGLFFLAAALAAPINHDESQYVAAIAMMRDGLPYRDWPYLQTPLQPLLLAPLSLLPAGWLMVGARLANVVFALVTCWALLRILHGRVPFWAAAAAVIGMATTNAFLFGTEVARNDMLPVALLTLGLMALLTPIGQVTARRAALAGLCFGLAISAKISFALPVAGAGLWLLWQVRTSGFGIVGAAIAGGLLGLLPCLLLFAIAPEQFLFGVFTYSLAAPQAYWSGVGEGERLLPMFKLTGILEELVEGAGGVALLLAFATMWRRGQGRHLFNLALIGGFIAAYLPDPFFRQYMIPILPPLFARAALALPEMSRRWQLAALTVGSVTAMVGASGSLAAIVRLPLTTPELVGMVERSRLLARFAEGGAVVTLSSGEFAGLDVELVPAFTAGPFLFRIHGNAGQRAHEAMGVPTFERMALLDKLAPAVIVTGGERKGRPPLFPQGLDIYLDRWAEERGYRPVRMPGDKWLMWVAPTQKGGP
jgi:hypothetical protein